MLADITVVDRIYIITGYTENTDIFVNLLK